MIHRKNCGFRNRLSGVLLRHALRQPGHLDRGTLVLDGFSKTYGITGWRLGYCHGPRRLIDEMIT
jgi:aspartate/methionine/tyrosine aminotransferase